MSTLSMTSGPILELDTITGWKILLIACLMFLGSFWYLIRIDLSLTLISFACVLVLFWYGLSKWKVMKVMPS